MKIPARVKKLTGFAAMFVSCIMLIAAESTRPTVIRYVDGSVTLIGFDPSGKELVKKLEWKEIQKTPIPGEAASFRKEISLAGFSDGSQRSLIKSLNGHGYYATGLAAKNSGLRQTYQAYDQRDNPIGKAETNSESGEENRIQ